MVNMLKIVNFKLVIEQPTLHPLESCICSFIGRAVVSINEENGDEYLAAEVVDLWLGVDLPANEHPYQYRQVEAPASTWRHKDAVSLQNKLESAAIEQYSNPAGSIELPDEYKPGQAFKKLINTYKPSELFTLPKFCG